MKYFSLLCALVIRAIAVPTAREYQIHEQRDFDFISNVWTERERLDGKTPLPVRIGLTQSNLDQGHDLLMELYGLFLVDREMIN